MLVNKKASHCTDFTMQRLADDCRAPPPRRCEAYFPARL
jgi:hypothetical protein